MHAKLRTCLNLLETWRTSSLIVMSTKILSKMFMVIIRSSIVYRGNSNMFFCSIPTSSRKWPFFFGDKEISENDFFHIFHLDRWDVKLKTLIKSLKFWSLWRESMLLEFMHRHYQHGKRFHLTYDKFIFVSFFFSQKGISLTNEFYSIR